MCFWRSILNVSSFASWKNMTKKLVHLIILSVTKNSKPHDSWSMNHNLYIAYFARFREGLFYFKSWFHSGHSESQICEKGWQVLIHGSDINNKRYISELHVFLVINLTENGNINPSFDYLKIIKKVLLSLILPEVFTKITSLFLLKENQNN